MMDEDVDTIAERSSVIVYLRKLASNADTDAMKAWFGESECGAYAKALNLAADAIKDRRHL